MINRASTRCALWTLSALCVGCAAILGDDSGDDGRRKQSALPQVKGPEATDLAARIGKGQLVMDRPVGGIIAMSLPALTESPVRRALEGQSTVHAVTGPDEKGRVVYVEEDWQRKKYAIRVRDLDGANDRVLVSGSGSPLWKHVVGSQISMHSTNGRLAWLKDSKGVQMRERSSLLFVGQLVITSVDDAKTIETDIRAIDPPGFTRTLAWFPDGKKIAYVDLTARKDAAATARPPTELEEGHGGWDRLPAVWIWDFDTSKSRFVHWGWSGVPTANGKAMLVCTSKDSGPKWLRVDLSTGETIPLSWPGASVGVIALLDEDLVLYWGYPTEGSEQKWTKFGSPLASRWAMWSIKVAEIPTGKFQTIIPEIDPRRSIDFGRVK